MRDFFVRVSAVALCCLFGVVLGLVIKHANKTSSIDAAMKVCELSHSREVCFSTLNR